MHAAAHEGSGEDAGRAEHVVIRISKLWASVITAVFAALLVAAVFGAISVRDRVAKLEYTVMTLAGSVQANTNRFEARPWRVEMESYEKLQQQQTDEIMRRFDRLETRLDQRR